MNPPLSTPASYPPPSEEALRAELCEIGRRVWQLGFVAANDGNFSCRLSDGNFLCTPTGVSKGFMQPEDMVVVGAHGAHVRGHRRVTSEFRMHLAIYRHRPDVAAVVHAHPPHATAFALRRQPLPRGVLPEIEVFLGEIPLVPYARFGTETMGDVLRPFLGQHVAWLLASHGAVTAGFTPLQAYLRMESVDFYCRILSISAALGGWRALAPHEVEELWNLRRELGYPDVTRGMTADQWIAGDSPQSSPPTP